MAYLNTFIDDNKIVTTMPAQGRLAEMGFTIERRNKTSRINPSTLTIEVTDELYAVYYSPNPDEYDYVPSVLVSSTKYIDGKLVEQFNHEVLSDERNYMDLLSEGKKLSDITSMHKAGFEIFMCDLSDNETLVALSTEDDIKAAWKSIHYSNDHCMAGQFMLRLVTPVGVN
jgi:hypothetical protein